MTVFEGECVCVREREGEVVGEGEDENVYVGVLECG